MSSTAKCQTCGRIFAPCAGCGGSNGLNAWRANCDTPECYQVFLAALEYRDGRMTKQELKEGLSRLDLDNILIADNAVKKIVTEALTDETPIRSRRRHSTIDSDPQEDASPEE